MTFGYSLLSAGLLSLSLWQAFMPSAVADTSTSRWVDAFFHYDLLKKPKSLSYSIYRPELLKESAGERLFNKLVAPGTDYSFDVFRGEVRSFAATATQEEAIAFMAKIGHTSVVALSKYEDVREGRDTRRGVSEEEMFRALRGERKVGNCTDIHNFLRVIATDLGFEDVGLNSINWSRAGASGNHAMLHFRNKLTREFLMQSYGEVIETRQKILHNALDLTAQVGGSYTNSMWVETEEGAVRLYQPRVSRWARQVLESESGYKATSPKPMLTLNLSNLEKTVGLRMGLPEFPYARAFFVYSSFNTSSGPTSLIVSGLSGGIALKQKLSDRLLDEVGFAASGYLGLDQLKVAKPVDLSPSTYNEPTHTAKVNAFFAVSAQGYARINSVTGSLELQGNMLDMGIGMKGGQASTPWHAFTPRIEYQATKSLRAGIERNTQLVSRTMNDWRIRLGTSYDKVDLVYDKRFGENQFYLVSQTGVYLFEGVEKMSAIGLKETLKAIIPAERLGHFTILAEASRVFGNTDNDPFYESEGTAYRIGTGWQRQMGRFLQIGADLKLDSSARPYFALEEPGTVTPELGRRDEAVVHGDVWLRTRF